MERRVIHDDPGVVGGGANSLSSYQFFLGGDFQLGAIGDGQELIADHFIFC